MAKKQPPATTLNTNEGDENGRTGDGIHTDSDSGSDVHGGDNGDSGSNGDAYGAGFAPVDALGDVHGQAAGNDRAASQGDDPDSDDFADFSTFRDTDEPAEETQQAERAKVLNFANLDKAESARQAHLTEIRDTVEEVTKRADAIRKNNLARFPETREQQVGGMMKTVILDSDRNRWEAFDMLYGGLMSPQRAFSNTFTGKLSDGKGREISAKFAMGDLVKAVSTMGLQGQQAKRLRESFIEWALEKERNPLIERIEKKLPKWDGKERMRESMMALFGCNDTDMTREAGWYFWSSLYARIMHPGANAPVVISLFGAQDAGKSYFAVRLVRMIMGDPGANPTKLDFSASEKDFLRTITGNSVIANVGEMVGFSKADMNKVKDMVTRSADTFDFKFKDADKKPRQWVVIMDANKYEGLQRDETGNRRFCPIFVGQTDDKDGKPAWRKGFKCPMITDGMSKEFEQYAWMCLAEARAWIRTNGGEEAIEHDGEEALTQSQAVAPTGVKTYEARAAKFSAMVGEFSLKEMGRDSGTVADSQLDNFLMDAITACEKTAWKGRGNSLGLFGVILYTGPLLVAIQKASGGNRAPIPAHLDTRMTSLGATIGKFTGGKKGYLFTQFASINDFEHVENGFAASMQGEFDGEEVATKAGARKDAHGGF